ERLIPGRKHSKTKDRGRLAPDAVAVARAHAEGVFPRRKAGIVRAPTASDLTPPGIFTIESVAELDSISHAESGGRVVDLVVPAIRGNLHCVRDWHLPVVDTDSFDEDWRHDGARQRSWVDARHDTVGCHPDPAIGARSD